MIVAAALALSLFSGPMHGGPTLVRTVTRPGGWTLGVTHDRFTGAVSCDLRRGEARIDGEWVTLELGRRVDTLLADVRLDAGQARNIRTFPTPFPDPNQERERHDDIVNPTGGRVVLPLAEVSKAQTVWVRPAPDKRAYRFNVAGLAQALDAARAAGCPTDSAA